MTDPSTIPGPAPVRRPVNAYRVQLSAGFDLEATGRALKYLRQLGATDCYTSPYLMATRGSASGYDVCDYQAVQPELGGAGGLEAFAAALVRESLGHIIDFVPNHMGADAVRNRWWRDVLRYGRRSAFAEYFDIDWAPTKPELRDRLLLPILGKPYGAALDDGDIRLGVAGGDLVVTYGPHELPLNPSTVRDGLEPQTLTADELHDLLEQQVYRLAYWRTSADEINYRRFFDVDGLVGVRMEREEVFSDAHRFLAALISRGVVTSIRVDHPDGLAHPVQYFDRLQRLCLQATGGRPLHIVVEKILGEGESLPADWAVDGTTGYDFLARLNGLFVAPAGSVALERLYVRLTGRSATFDAEAYTSKELIMETTLASEVQMLAHALNRISERHRRSRDFTLSSLRQALVEFIASLPVYRTYLRPSTADDQEIARVRRAIRWARQRNEHLEASVFAFLEAVLLDGRVPGGTGYPAADEADANDRRRFTERLQQFTGSVVAKGIEDTAFYRHPALLSANEVGGTPAHPSRPPLDLHEDNRRRAERAPLGLVASSTHDTKLGEDARARLNVLSEMPLEWGRQVRRWRVLTKTLRTRGSAGDREDVGNASGFPDVTDEYRFFQALVGTWPAEHLGAAIDGDWPHYVTRLSDYMRKAAREAKRHTSWINPNAAYEDALSAFVEGALTAARAQRFRDAVRPFARRVARIGVVNALAQLVLKIGSPGVVDVYQGAELWNLSLVDPDNRRAVDFARHEELLRGLEPLLARVGQPDDAVRRDLRDLLDDWPSGRIKLFVTAAGLRLRRASPDLFLAAGYEPLVVDRQGTADIVAFLRRRPDSGLLVAAPRFVASLMSNDERATWPLGGEAWQGTRVRMPSDLDGCPLRNVLTGERFAVETIGGVAGLAGGQLLSDLPVGIWTWGTVE